MILENTPTVETERLILRKFETADREDMFEILSDEKTNTFLPWFTVRNVGEAERFINERYISFYERESAYRYAICLKESMKVVGYIGISDDDSHDLGYGINRKFWGQGCMTEAFREVLRFAFEENGVFRLTTGCDPENRGSERVMVKCGLIKEADMKQKVWMDGRMRDRVEYRMLKTEWEERK